jgi:hypothetical protein
LAALKREWKRASPTEKRQFVVWLRAGRVSAARPHSPVPKITDSHGYLLAKVADFLSKWTRDRKLMPGQIMKRMGFSQYDYRLAEAINAPRPLAEEVIAKLGPWLAREGFR